MLFIRNFFNLCLLLEISVTFLQLEFFEFQSPGVNFHLLDYFILSDIFLTLSYQDIFPYNGTAYATFWKQIVTP